MIRTVWTVIYGEVMGGSATYFDVIISTTHDLTNHSNLRTNLTKSNIMVGKVNVTSLSIIPITSDDFNENTLCILKWSKESVSRQGLLTQQMNDPLHLQWESTIEALCPSDQSDSKNVLDNVESFFWKVEVSSTLLTYPKIFLISLFYRG